MFDFLPKWRDNAKFCQKMTPKWGFLPIFLFFRTPVPGIFAPFLAFPKSRSFRYIGKNELSDNLHFRPFFPLYRGKHEKFIACYGCNTHFFLVWHHDIIALRQKSREQTDRHFWGQALLRWICFSLFVSCRKGDSYEQNKNRYTETGSDPHPGDKGREGGASETLFLSGI